MSDCCSQNDACSSKDKKKVKDIFTANPYVSSVFSFALLAIGMCLEYLVQPAFFQGPLRFFWYLIAYIPVAFPVLKNAVKSIVNGQVFNEFFLMSIATIGAFAIGQYAEGVGVMLFYSFGEILQHAAVNRARGNIQSLLDVRPEIARVFRSNKFTEVHPEEVNVGERIEVKVGEKIPLDGELLSEQTSVNTAAITGESKPKTVLKGEEILAGSINLSHVIEMKASRAFAESSISKIVELVQNANSNKAKTELLMRKLAKIYTPIVTYLAIAITVLPYFFVSDYVFTEWLSRSLIFLVISCPCALIVSIPLGYFGGIGAASKNGILFKGGNFLDQLTKINTLVVDKTGTLTKGVFQLKTIVSEDDYSEGELMNYLAAVEQKSTHPIAKAILNYSEDSEYWEARNVKEIHGKGLKAEVKGKAVLAGSAKLLEEAGINFPQEIADIPETTILVSISGKFAGYVIVADAYKDNVAESIRKIKTQGIGEIIMLSGDKQKLTEKVARDLGIDEARGGLLPEEKLRAVKEIQADRDKKVAFIGDGINDAPVLISSDIGVAMGAMGSDLAIESADVVLQTDEPLKFLTALNISKATRKIIWQNIALAFGVKLIVMAFGALGYANLWIAVFSDVGVALLAIANAVRLQQMKFETSSNPAANNKKPIKSSAQGAFSPELASEKNP